MRLRSFTAAAIFILTSIGRVYGAAPEGPALEQQPNKPIVTFTRQNAFTIPFRIDAPQVPGQQPVEAQLHMSTNQGTTWELSSRVKAEAGAFVFRAPHDGEYWYSIRTIDKFGKSRPDGPLEPQLKVTVDTVAPRLDLAAQRGEAGEVVARWQAVDPHLKPGSLRLEYQTNGSGTWERVAVEQPADNTRHTSSGEATWWPRAGVDSVQVRAEVTDASGNPSVSHATVKLSPAAIAAENTRGPADNARGAGGETSRGTAGDAARNPARDGTQWPADRSSRDPLARATDGDWRGNDASHDPTRPRNTPAQNVSQNLRGTRSSLDFSLLPGGARPRMVNARAFELEYELESVGPSGVSKVELWGTRDGGRTWTLFGTDTDNRSPMPVGVDAEGIYGFRIAVQSGSGLGGRAPADGEQPDIWIGVDLTKPVGRISGAEVDAESNELAIRWEASDDVPDPRPITISLSATLDGPWTPIASGLENTGNYRWRLDSRVPDRIFLRLEVRDEAGNIGTYDTAEPVSLDRHRPEGRIRGVRPLSQ